MNPSESEAVLRQMIGAATKRGQMFATDGKGGQAAIDPPVECSHDLHSGHTYAADDIEFLLDALSKGTLLCAGGRNTLMIVRSPDYEAILGFDTTLCLPAWIPEGKIDLDDYLWTSGAIMPEWKQYRHLASS